MFDLRILFWTDWDATFPRIEAASMSGVGRHIVFKDMETGAWPNGLTLDHQEKRIVWTDARYGIGAVLFWADAFAHVSFSHVTIDSRKSHCSFLKNSHLCDSSGDLNNEGHQICKDLCSVSI